MTSEQRWDAVVVGSGPNGLAAGITLARAGRSVVVLEANPTIGGGARSAALTLPGFVHDLCSAVHPLGASSPAFARWPLKEHGLEWIQPPVAVAHPLDDGSAALVRQNLDATAGQLGADGEAYRRLVGPVARDWPLIATDLLGPFRPGRIARHPFRFARFGWHALQPATALARRFATPQARALLGGVAAHSFLRFDRAVSGGFALVLLGAAHSAGWPFARGGSQAITDALAAYLRSLGGEIRSGCKVTRMEDLPSHRSVLFDVTPRQLLAIAGDRLRGSYAAQLRRFRYGPGVFKLDLALSEPIPWANPEVGEAGTVHLGGSFEEVAAAARSVARGRVSERPFVLLAQPSRFDPGRAPDARHTAWAYCHVPNGSGADMTEPILAQVERFAPGFRKLIIGRSAMDAAAVEFHNANHVGGDINGGLASLTQLLTRPAIRPDPYTTPDPTIFICSASTPPGGGVHGLCGYHAARSVLRRALR
ncbi:MAG TPA: NAD(P)/FAD-dependent oxidoreductase [Candidatus Limnocylindria bacterium]